MKRIPQEALSPGENTVEKSHFCTVWILFYLSPGSEPNFWVVQGSPKKPRLSRVFLMLLSINKYLNHCHPCYWGLLLTKNAHETLKGMKVCASFAVSKKCQFSCLIYSDSEHHIQIQNFGSLWARSLASTLIRMPLENGVFEVEHISQVWWSLSLTANFL